MNLGGTQDRVTWKMAKKALKDDQKREKYRPEMNKTLTYKDITKKNAKEAKYRHYSAGGREGSE